MIQTNIDQYAKVTETADFLKPLFSAQPEIALLTGTGLGDIANSISVDQSLPYAEIPNFPTSTVQSHSGNLFLGTLKNKSVMALQGRFHLYEGYSAQEVTFPIRVMQQLGVKTVILTNAAGGLNPDFRPGDIMIIQDHINLTGENPLVGPNIDSWGDRFPDMMTAYDKQLMDIAAHEAVSEQISVQKGIYAGLKGPSLETPAEVRYLKTIGGDAVGFSTVMEVIAAVHSAIPVLGLSIITNVHHPEAPIPASVEEIIQTANDVAPELEKLIARIIEIL